VAGSGFDRVDPGDLEIDTTSEKGYRERLADRFSLGLAVTLGSLAIAGVMIYIKLTDPRWDDAYLPVVWIPLVLAVPAGFFTWWVMKKIRAYDRGEIASPGTHDAPSSRMPRDEAAESPQLSGEEKQRIIDEAFAQIDQHLRKASIAQVGGFRPPKDPTSSWFGGVNMAAAGESWPTNEGRPMMPLIQIRVDELPYIPPPLSSVALVTVFIGPDELPASQRTADGWTWPSNGEGWSLRTYENLDDLVPIEPPDVDFPIKPFPIRWHLAEGEGPDWDDATQLIDASRFLDAQGDDDSLFHDRYHNSEQTKVGGWPALIQSDLDTKGDFVFQIGTETKANWSWGDRGIGYFLLDVDGNWQLTWQCY
jgi:hypothetical protein